MATTQPIRNKEHVCALINYYKDKGKMRNYVLVTLSIHTALRISDLLSLTWDDVYDFANDCFYDTVTITEQKTGKNKIVALSEEVIKALSAYQFAAEPNAALILNKRTQKAISRIQAYRLIRSAAESLRLTGRTSCHSLRKTFGYHAWKTGVSPAVIMEIYNHTSLAVTKKYLGVTQDEQNAVYRGLCFV